MTFNFNPPNNGQPLQPTAPAANPFAPPPQQAAANPMSAAQALAGFGEGAIDARHPFLPLGFAGELELLSTEGKDGRETGFAYYIDAKVTRIANPGGGDAAVAQATSYRTKNANVTPAREGSIYTIRISGFKNENSRKFAISDTKLFLCAIMEQDGLKPDVALPPSEWDRMASAMAGNQLGKAGRRFLADVAAVSSKSGVGKVKVSFYPVSAAG